MLRQRAMLHGDEAAIPPLQQRRLQMQLEGTCCALSDDLECTRCTRERASERQRLDLAHSRLFSRLAEGTVVRIKGRIRVALIPLSTAS
jgi:hypothetical protein